MLVEKICKKIGIDETSRKVKLSYILCTSQRETSIVDDDDFLGYLTVVNAKGIRPALNVEVVNKESERVEQNSRVERRSSVGINYEELNAFDVENGGVVTIFRGEDAGGNCVNAEPIIEEANSVEEAIENADSRVFEEAMENVVIEDREHVDSRMDVAEDNGVDGRIEYYELPCVGEGSQSSEKSQSVTEWEDGTEIELHQEFVSKEAVQDLVNRAANKYCFATTTIASDPQRLMLRCRQSKTTGCRWKMHTCKRSDKNSGNCKHTGTPRLIASILYEDYREWVCIARMLPHGEGKDNTLVMCVEVNPGTISYVEVDAQQKFKYLFVALGACIEGFKVMRKVVIVDATFLKTVYGGMLVFATAQDPNHHNYIIASAVIDRENDASWSWFFNKLKTVIPDVPGLVFVSDRHQSIIKSIMQVFPNARHGHCVWHLSQNVKVRVKTEKEEAAANFIACAHVYTQFEFTREYARFRRRFPNVGPYLDRWAPVENWAMCYFEGDRYNIDTSNACESLNSTFERARKYFLLPLLDAIIEKISEWFNKHRKESVKYSKTRGLVPVVENEIHSLCPIAKTMPVTELNSFERQYSVIGEGEERSDDPSKYDGDFGVPQICFCGKQLELVERLIGDQKKTFLKCPMSGQDDNYHVDKGWDLAVHEQCFCIDKRFGEHRELIQNAFKFGGDSNRLQINQIHAEIEDLKHRLDKKDAEIARLMDALGKK
ncbi:contains a short region of similarity to transposases [Arabidopsis thaliana]|uniref:A_TM021B04.1 protein n=1 Tax=Arabidopsis thaliana TaxID=3702 RepID=O04653_ARATH|nr:contains a short region of similarity to transposases [Arabidopsis thaliana]